MRDHLMVRHKFAALRVWCGFSSIFFTLNPNEWSSTLTLKFCGPYNEEMRDFSLGLSDEEMAQVYGSLERGRKMHLLLMSGEDVVASTKCFWETFRLVFEEVLHCHPASHERRRGMQPPDGLICKDTPGSFAYISHFLVVVEPQMRKALHGHGLLGVVGFTQPEVFFALPGLAEKIKRAWHYVASICFRSVEAFAAHMHEPVHVSAALRTAPLMPVKKAQFDVIGPRRSAQVHAAQLVARGMAAKCPAQEQIKRPFTAWTPASLRDKDLSSGAWASLVVADVNAGNRACGNHVCRPDVCHKTSKGRDGYCRMMMWHYAKASVDGRDRVVKAHGRQLEPRWCKPATKDDPFPSAGVAGDFPPFHAMPPQAGMPSLETNHCFHVKSSPVVLETARCNNDVTPLLRISNALLDFLRKGMDAEHGDREPEPVCY
jgi:hypothetical protein